MSEKVFDPQKYMTYIKEKPYLKPVHRILWFKIENGHNGRITTELITVEPFPIVKAFIHLNGEVIATAYATAQIKQGAVYFGREVEKAETAAIGRALSYAGYGTQFSDDDDDEHLADSPIDMGRKESNKPITQLPQHNQSTQSDGVEKHYACSQMTILLRGDNQYQYIAKCGHNLNIVTYTSELYKATLGEDVIAEWKDGVTAKGKVIKFEKDLQLVGIVEGQAVKLVRVIG